MRLSLKRYLQVEYKYRVCTTTSKNVIERYFSKMKPPRKRMFGEVCIVSGLTCLAI